MPNPTWEAPNLLTLQVRGSPFHQSPPPPIPWGLGLPQSSSLRTTAAFTVLPLPEFNEYVFCVSAQICLGPGESEGAESRDGGRLRATRGPDASLDLTHLSQTHLTNGASEAQTQSVKGRDKSQAQVCLPTTLHLLFPTERRVFQKVHIMRRSWHLFPFF